MPMNTSDNRQNGSVMIIVLVLMLVSISLALYTVSLSRDIVGTSRQLLDKLTASLEAGSAVEKIKFIGATGRYGEWYLENPGGNKEFPLRLSLRGDAMTAGNSEIRLIDSAAKLGVRPPNTDLLKKILLAGGVAAADIAVAVDSLEDWLDEDDLKHLNGAETYYYRSEQSLGYSPRNMVFMQSADELQLIRGFQGKVYGLLQNEILDTRGGTLNINTADAAMMSAVLGIDSEGGRRLVQLRDKKGFLTQTDLIGQTGNGLTFMDEYITTFPSMTLAVDIRTRVNEAGCFIKAIINFRPGREKPFAVEKFEG